MLLQGSIICALIIPYNNLIKLYRLFDNSDIFKLTILYNKGNVGLISYAR